MVVVCRYWSVLFVALARRMPRLGLWTPALYLMGSFNGHLSLTKQCHSIHLGPKKLRNPENRTPGSRVRSANSTSVLCYDIDNYHASSIIVLSRATMTTTTIKVLTPTTANLRTTMTKRQQPQQLESRGSSSTKRRRRKRPMWRDEATGKTNSLSTYFSCTTWNPEKLRYW